MIYDDEKTQHVRYEDIKNEYLEIITYNKEEVKWGGDEWIY